MIKRDHLLIICMLLLIFNSCKSESSEFRNDNFNPVKIEAGSILFVGMIGETPSLYTYDIVKNEYQQFWYKPREIVVDLSISPNFMKAFFITALSIEEGGSLPLIRKVKLYLVDLNTMEVTHIKNYGIAGQIITSWEDENNYKIVINTLDKIIATDINQSTQLFNVFGKLLIDETKTFDLLKDGYPQPQKVKKNNESYSKRYFLQVSDDNRTYLLNDRSTNMNDTIASYPLQVNQFTWSYDDKYITANFNYQNIDYSGGDSMYTSSIIFYSLNNKRIQREWKGPGIKNYYQLNELVIFDNGLGHESELVIYNLETDKVINHIRINEGCGLKNIPGRLTYGVVE